MSGSSDPYGICYAMFLVTIFPQKAITLLSDGSICDRAKVEQDVDRACEMLGPFHEIKGLVVARKFGELKAKATEAGILHAGPGSPLSSAASPRRALPSPPSSAASGLQPRSSTDTIVVLYHDASSFPFSAKYHSSEWNFIREDKLQRIPNPGTIILPDPQFVRLKSEVVRCHEYVQFAWSRQGDLGTEYERFYIVPCDKIPEADILLGRQLPKQWGQRHYNGSSGHSSPTSPFSLEVQHTVRPHVPPPVPMPPHQAGPSTALYSARGGYPPSVDPFNHVQGHMDRASPTYSPPAHPRSAKATFSQKSSKNSAGMQPFPAIANPASRPDSPASQRVDDGDTVMVSFTFLGKTPKVQRLDLKLSGEAVLSCFMTHLQKRSRADQLDRSAHEMTVTLVANKELETTCPLEESDFDSYWQTMVDFIRDNKSGVWTAKAEFAIDIA